MTAATPLIPGTIFLIDTSVATRMQHPGVRSYILQCIDDGIAATCATIDLEAVFSGQNPTEVESIAKERREFFTVLPITEAIVRRARDVQVLMASRGLHRAAGPLDLLTAAVAEHYRATVLHYDGDFEHIASVTGQQQQWVAPRGSID